MIHFGYSGCGKAVVQLDDVTTVHCGDYADRLPSFFEGMFDSMQRDDQDRVRVYCGDCGSELVDDEALMDFITERAKACPRKFLIGCLAEAMRANYEYNPSAHSVLYWVELGRKMKAQVPCLCGTCVQTPQELVGHVDGFRTLSEVVDEVLKAHKPNKP